MTFQALTPYAEVLSSFYFRSIDVGIGFSVGGNLCTLKAGKGRYCFVAAWFLGKEAIHRSKDGNIQTE